MIRPRQPSAEAAAVARCDPHGVTVTDMPGGWRAVIARHGGRYRAFYHRAADDPRLAAVHQRWAAQWLATAAQQHA